MSKQQKRKYEVMRSLTEEQIKSVGSNRWLRHRGVLFLWVGVAYMVVMAILQVVTDAKSDIFAWCVVGGFIVLWFYVIAMTVLKGRELWRQVKDQNEPIDLRDYGD